MLTAVINTLDRLENVESSPAGITFGHSYISKFSSDFLSFSSISHDAFTYCWIGEREDPCHDNPSARRHDFIRQIESFQGVAITFGAQPEDPIKISRTEAAGCPIYLAITKSGLVISWQFEFVANALEKRFPNPTACKRFLELGPKPTRDQILHGMFMLWPGERCTVRQGHVSFDEVIPKRIVQSGVIHDNATATDAFVELLSDAMLPLIRQAKSPIIELSGGLDSACVAIAAARIRDEIASFAAIQQGAIGRQQQNRRRELIERIGLQDATGPSDSITPFAALQLDECTQTPFDDIFRMSCMSALDIHPIKDFDLVLTGIGGDELTMENTIGRENWEVRSSISSSANDASAGRADMYMRRGIWLCQPLTSRRVVDFCRALPESLRRGRLLNLLALARAGMSDGFLLPRYGEHFGVMTLNEAAVFDFDEAFSQSVLADYGLYNLDEVLNDARKATVHGFSLELVTRLWFLLKLEVILRRYC